MPAHSTRPSPPARVVELLTETKVQLLRAQGFVTAQDFEREWAQAWALMVTERAWPHASEHRRQWRQAMVRTKPEVRAAWLDEPTVFSELAAALIEAAARMHVDLETSDLPKVIIGAIRAGYLSENETSEGVAA